jgi:hypothetical protein
VRIIPSALAALAVLACSACLPDHYAFLVDDRLTITSPKNQDEVTLPVTIRWNIEDFDVVEPGSPVHDKAGYFAVFVDRTPMPPGESLTWLARGDSACDPAAGCPDDEYLAQRDVYVTTDTELVLNELEEGREGRRERHTISIVLVDPSGKRIGESAFYVDFEVRRGEQS